MTQRENDFHIEADSQSGIVASGNVNHSPVYHNSTVYHAQDASPERKFEIGCRYLENGNPSEARKNINAAIAGGYDGPDVRFHQALALLSKRSCRDLTEDERQQLASAEAKSSYFADGEEKSALRTVFTVLKFDPSTAQGTVTVRDALARTTPDYQHKIRDHLEFVIAGAVKDEFWGEIVAEAEKQQESDDRRGRIWAYFHPNPAPPRLFKPEPVTTTRQDWAHALVGSTVFAWSIVQLGWLPLQQVAPLPTASFVLMLVAGCITIYEGSRWRYRTLRLRVKDRLYGPAPVLPRPPEGGFANTVDKDFRHYINKYTPRGHDRERWLLETAGVRRTLRDEICELYRESRIPAEKVRWLVRFYASEIRRKWIKGELFEYRRQYRTSLTTRARCLLGAAVFSATAVVTAVYAFNAAPLTAVIATLVAVAGGRSATLGWFTIVSEWNRFDEDRKEYDLRQSTLREAYACWVKKLQDTRPTEEQMETWLAADKTLFIDEALRKFHLSWKDIIAHASLHVPGNGARRARIDGGQWRYSKYRLHLFLITARGVREIATDLDFKYVMRNGLERHDYRFAAFSSVHVTETDGCEIVLELTLSNGPSREIRVNAEEEQSEPGTVEDHALARMNLESSGLPHTLHILEGIASEGGDWIWYV